MAHFKKLELELDHQFDRARCRHYLNGQLVVFHCHHYSTLYTQLALDAEFLDGKMLLAQCAEDAFYPILKDYLAANPKIGLGDKFSLACQYYAAVGLGKMEVKWAGPDAGEVILSHSHIDAGWVKKWGPSDKPVNYLTSGYLAALFAVVFDLPPRSFVITEMDSAAMGAAQSRFSVVRN